MTEQDLTDVYIEFASAIIDDLIPQSTAERMTESQIIHWVENNCFPIRDVQKDRQERNYQ